MLKFAVPHTLITYSPFHALLAGTAAAPVSLIVFAPFMRGLLGGLLLMFCSWCTCPFWARLARTGVAPVLLMASASFRARLARMAVALVSLMVCFPSRTRLAETAIVLVFAHCVRPVLCETRWGGHCSGFAHGGFAPFRAWLTKMAVAPVSLMFFTPFVRGLLGGHCSGFAHGVFAAFMHSSLGRLLLLSCSCLLLP